MISSTKVTQAICHPLNAEAPVGLSSVSISALEPARQLVITKVPDCVTNNFVKPTIENADIRRRVCDSLSNRRHLSCEEQSRQVQ